MRRSANRCRSSAHGFTYDAAGKCFFAWPERNGNGPLKDGEIIRWDLPADLDAAFVAKIVRSDGPGTAKATPTATAGSRPPARTLFASLPRSITTATSRGSITLKWTSSSSGGWNWANWQMSGATDLTGFEKLTFYVKLTGSKPTQVQTCMACGPDKVASEIVDLAKYAPDYGDGQWHLVSVPLKDLSGASKFDPKAAYELRFSTTEAKDSTFDLYVDVVRFLKAPAK